MKLDLITLSGNKFSEEVYEVQLPTANGPIAVFPGHQPLITLMQTGVISVRRKRGDSDSQLEIFAATGGVAEITAERVKLLIDEAEHSDDITEAQATEALKRAEELKARAKDSLELEKAQQLIDRHAVRIKVAGLRRRHMR
ncbi:ATP synthase F1 subunit epsilon [Candidatus Saccharibacteria bacterium]|nr:ATP synthase F1 subunit epsilon [Candidatus Saccharibacteria bacterium]